MGKIGTEVAKEAADIILLDDNFGSIVSAVEEGRSIYKTTKKVILYLFSTSFGEVLTITGALVLGLPLPVLAVQLLWLNFVTDGFLDVSLAMEPREAGLLNKRAAAGSSSLLDGLMLRRMLTMALPMAIGALLLFSRYVGGDMVKAWTISVTVLAVFQWFNAWNCRSESQSIFRRNIFSNKYLLGATAIVGSLQLLAVYHPFFQNYLRTTALNFSEWGLIIATAASIILVEEIRKYFYRREESRNFSH
jgi:Ca2+-transporting ATPase